MNPKLLFATLPLFVAALWRGAAHSQDAPLASNTTAPRSLAPRLRPTPARDTAAKVQIAPLPPRGSSQAPKPAKIEVAAPLPPLSSLDDDFPFAGSSSRFIMPHDGRFALILKGWPALKPLPTPASRPLGRMPLEDTFARRLRAHIFIKKAYARADSSQPWREFPVARIGRRGQIITRGASWNGKRYLVGFVRAWGGGQWRYDGELRVFPGPFGMRSANGLVRHKVQIEVAAPLAGSKKWPPPWARTRDEADARTARITAIEYRSTLNPQWQKVPRQGEKGFPLVVPRRGGKWQFRAVFGDPTKRGSEVWPLWSGRYFNTDFAFESGQNLRWLSSYSSKTNPDAMEEIASERGFKRQVLKQNGLFELQVQGANTLKAQFKIGPDGYAQGDYEYDRRQELRSAGRWRERNDRFHQNLRPADGYSQWNGAIIGIAPQGLAPSPRSFIATIDERAVRVRFRCEDPSIQINGPGPKDDIAVSDRARNVGAQVYAPRKVSSTILWAEVLDSGDNVVARSSLPILFRPMEWHVVYGAWRLSSQSGARGEVFERPVWVWQGTRAGRNGYQSINDVHTVPIRLRDQTAPRQTPNPKRVWLSSATLKTHHNPLFGAPDEKRVPPGTMQFFRADPALPGTRQMAAFEVGVGHSKEDAP